MIVDLVYDSIVARSNSPLTRTTDESSCSWRPRVLN